MIHGPPPTLTWLCVNRCERWPSIIITEFCVIRKIAYNYLTADLGFIWSGMKINKFHELTLEPDISGVTTILLGRSKALSGVWLTISGPGMSEKLARHEHSSGCCHFVQIRHPVIIFPFPLDHRVSKLERTLNKTYLAVISSLLKPVLFLHR